MQDSKNMGPISPWVEEEHVSRETASDIKIWAQCSTLPFLYQVAFSLGIQSPILPECFPFPTPFQMQSPKRWSMVNTQASVIF